MTWPDLYLLCFSVGGLWSLVALLGSFGGLGSMSHGHAHFHFHHGPHVHSHAGHTHTPGGGAPSWLGTLLNPSSAAIFLAWFGAVGYLLQRHSPWSAVVDLTAAILVGLAGMFILAWFVRWMQTKERPLNPADYHIPGVLGKVSSPIRAEGVGEVIYLRDGSRTPLPARSDNGQAIGRGVEVIVTRYEKGIAYVRTWDEMTQVSFQEEKHNEQ